LHHRGRGALKRRDKSEGGAGLEACVEGGHLDRALAPEVSVFPFPPIIDIDDHVLPKGLIQTYPVFPCALCVTDFFYRIYLDKS
jgi:hypothetical protein